MHATSSGRKAGIRAALLPHTLASIATPQLPPSFMSTGNASFARRAASHVHGPGAALFAMPVNSYATQASDGFLAVGGFLLSGTSQTGPFRWVREASQAYRSEVMIHVLVGNELNGTYMCWLATS
jgi:hypothetical protein